MPGLGQVGQADAVLLGLVVHPAQRGAHLLGLHRADRFAVHAQQVIGEAGLEVELAHRHPAPGVEVHILAVLHLPAGGLELPVDLYARLLLR